jgi:hypothetical protein
MFNFHLREIDLKDENGIPQEPYHRTYRAEELPSNLLQNIISTVATFSWIPWKVPSEEELGNMTALFESPQPKMWGSCMDSYASLRYYQSATTQAICFLESIRSQ